MNDVSHVLTVSNLTHTYRGKHAVDSLSFQVSAGEVLAVVGRNGAGKTTTLKCLTGLLQPDAGEVSIDGESTPWRNSRARQLCGFCPETPSLYTAYTVGEQLKLACDLRRLKGSEASDAIDRVIHQCDLLLSRDRIIGELSKGYRQRVSLAQALIGSPRLLVLDEPASGLDPVHIAQLRLLIADLVPEMTVILSTHSLSDAAAVADRLLVMSDGRACYHGELEPPERASAFELQLDKALDSGQQSLLEQMAAITVVNGLDLELTLRADIDSATLIEQLVQAGARINALLPRQHLTEDDMLDLITQSSQQGNES